MINIKDIYVKVLHAIKQDDELLDLLEIEHGEHIDNNEFMIKLREQVVDVSYPDDMLNDYTIKLCIHENGGTYREINTETSYMAIDIHITKDKNAIDRRSFMIIKRLIEVLDSKERQKEYKEPLRIGLYGLEYSTRIIDSYERNSTTGWERYQVVFKYSYLI